MEDRRQGWLSEDFHQRFRWLLLHACARYDVACPIYCLMPDHVHLLLAGWTQKADQILFMRSLRRHTHLLLYNRVQVGWQKQAYDHVLRPHESDRYSFESLAHYIAENPVRAGLAASRTEWPYTEALIPGYPEMTLELPDYWIRYWRIVASRSGL